MYCLGYFINGEFDHYVRKSRNNNIVAYEDLSSAKRGLSQSKRGVTPERYKIIRVQIVEIVEV